MNDEDNAAERAADTASGASPLLYEFSAFVSYRHLDSTEPGQQWAEWVQTLLERYTTPPELAGQVSLYGDAVPATMPRVFRDQDQLPAHGNLGSLIHEALERSRVLVVLCTPAAVVSPWVADEILQFKKLGRSDRIIAIVLRGKPHAIDPADECYPEPLRFKLGADGTLNQAEKEHPIYIDLRPPLGTMGATTAAEYRALLQAADLYKDPAIEQAVVKYTHQLEEARILLLSGALGLTPRDLTQRDLLRRIEEEKQRTAEAAARAAWEAEQKRVATSARAVAEKARLDADNQRFSAVIAKWIAIFFLALLAITVPFVIWSSRKGWSAQKQAAVESATFANLLMLKIFALVLMTLLLGLSIAAFVYYAKYCSHKKRADDTLTHRNRALWAFSHANRVVELLRSRFAGVASSDDLAYVDGVIADYHKMYPPDSDFQNFNAYIKATQFIKEGDGDSTGGRLDTARSSYQAAIEILEPLSRHEPGNMDWNRALANAYAKLGHLLEKKGDREAALTHYRSSLKIRVEFADHNWWDAEWQRDTISSYLSIGGVEEVVDVKAALATYRRAHEILQREFLHERWTIQYAHVQAGIAGLLSELPSGDKEEVKRLVRDGIARLEDLLTYNKDRGGDFTTTLEALRALDREGPRRPIIRNRKFL